MPEASIGGRRLHYLDQGKGEPALVLLHAFPLRAAMWNPQMDALAATTRVVAPDLLGFGATEAPDDPSAYSVDVWADQVAALADHLELDRVVLGGLSMGGYAAFAFVRRHRRRLAGLLLADTRPGPDTPEVAVRRQDQVRQLREQGSSGLVDGMLDGLLAEHTRQFRPDVVGAARALMDSSPAGWIGALEAMIRRPDSGPDLATVDVPTSVVVGAADRLSPPDVAATMRSAIPRATLSVLADAGHLSNLEAPDAFTDAVGDLLGRCREAGRRT